MPESPAADQASSVQTSQGEQSAAVMARMGAEIQALDRRFNEYRRDEAIRQALVASGIEGRLEKLNELRTEVITDRAEYVRKDAHDAEMRALATRLAMLERFQTRAGVIGAGMVLVSGAVGAAIMKALTG